jgi:cell division protein FtsQ
MKGKKWFIALQRLMVLAIVITSLAFAESKVDDLVLSQVEVNVYSEAGHRFVLPSELEKQVADFLGDTSSLVLAEINISMLEEMLLQLPSVAQAEVYFDLNGVLCASVYQREPFLRVLNGKYQGYWDSEGEWFPIAKDYSTNVPLILGNPDSVKVRMTISVHEKLIEDSFYTDFVSAYEWMDGDLVVYPRFGVSAVNWGNPDQLFDSKRNRLKKAYINVFPAMGFDRYKSINLKFADQVVGIKREDHGGR